MVDIDGKTYDTETVRRLIIDTRSQLQAQKAL